MQHCKLLYVVQMSLLYIACSSAQHASPIVNTCKDYNHSNVSQVPKTRSLQMSLMQMSDDKIYLGPCGRGLYLLRIW